MWIYLLITTAKALPAIGGSRPSQDYAHNVGAAPPDLKIFLRPFQDRPTD